MLERVLACDVVIAVYKIGTLFPFLLSSMHMIISSSRWPLGLTIYEGGVNFKALSPFCIPTLLVDNSCTEQKLKEGENIEQAFPLFL